MTAANCTRYEVLYAFVNFLLRRIVFQNAKWKCPLKISQQRAYVASQASAFNISSHFSNWNASTVYLFDARAQWTVATLFRTRLFTIFMIRFHRLFFIFFYFFCIFLFFLRCPPLNQLWFNAICLLVLWNYESGHSKCQHNATQKQKTSLDIWNTFLSPSSRSLWRINSICYGSSFASQCLAAQHFALAFDICRL